MPERKNRGLLRIMSSSSSNNEADGGRWSRVKRLASGNYTLRERPSGPDSEAAGERAASVDDGVEVTTYRTYKRRWFGLIQLTLMNIVVSWDVSSPRRAWRSE